MPAVQPVQPLPPVPGTERAPPAPSVSLAAPLPDGGARPQLAARAAAAVRAIPLPTAAVVLAYLLAYGCWQLFRVGGAGHQTLIGDLAFIPLNLGAALLAWGAARRCGERRRLRSAWRLIAVGLLSYLLADLVQTYYEVALSAKPYPSFADPLYVLFYPLAVVGLLRFPTARRSRAQHTQLIIDAATVAVGGAAAVWYVVLGPTAVSDTGSALQTFFSIAYPVGDLVLVVALASVLLRQTIPSSRQALYWLMGGVGFFIAADLVYGWIGFHGSYSGGDPVDSLWMVAIGVFAIGAAAQRAPVAGEAPPAAAARRASWIPWLAVLVVFGLLADAMRGDPFFPDVSLLVCAVIAGALVAARQWSAQRELITTHGQLSRAHDELAALATTDPLTALPNHRALNAALEHELERSRRYGRPCAVLFLDIDHFKALNDACGHAAGDNALHELGVVAARALRGVDIIGRWGGEEFVALLPETGPEAAIEAAERLRAAIAAHIFEVAGGAHLTCSVGAACYPDDGESRTALIDAADRAMYAAKALGRNQAIAASDPVVAALDDHPENGSSRDEQGLLGAVEALALLVDVRDSYTGRHAQGVADMSRKLAVALGCDAGEARAIGLAGRLHDVGKVVVPDAILQKPGPLTHGEWDLVKRHPGVGAEVLGHIPSLRMIAPLVRSHHERWDGSGYPDGLAANAIPLGARVIGTADAYDAMITERPYRRALSTDDALDELRRCAGKQFDPAVVDQIARVIAADTTAEPAVADRPGSGGDPARARSFIG